MVHSTLSHSELLAIIQNLDTDEQMRLMEELVIIVRNKAKGKNAISWNLKDWVKRPGNQSMLRTM